MTRFRKLFRTALPLAAVALVVTAIALAPHLGASAATHAIWNETPVAVAPATTPAPNWVAIAKELKPAVVNVSTRSMQRGNDQTDPFFQQFFGRQPRHSVRGLGSGFVINPDGYLITNNHVVDGAADVRVKLSDGRQLPARVFGHDARTDLALLKIDAAGLTAIPLGDSAALQVGEPVMAIGNPFGLEQTVTTGIVSATGRVIGEGPYDDFVQTDASINPGNSGGPLINARGQVIGINTAIFSQTGGSVGIGFAIPVNLAKSVVAQLANGGQVVRGWLGVGIQPVTADLAKGFKLPGAEGALVTSVSDGSPAARAGLKAGDVIVEYDGRKVARASELPRAVAETPVGRNVSLKVMRDGQPLTLTATVSRLEDMRQARASEDDGSAKRTTLGISARTLTPQVAQEVGIRAERGVLVVDVRDGSPAENAGLQPGDVISEVDHRAVTAVPEMQRALEQHPKGTPIVLLVQRDGEPLWLAVTA
jgi:serine protease Do